MKRRFARPARSKGVADRTASIKTACIMSDGIDGPPPGSVPVPNGPAEPDESARLLAEAQGVRAAIRGKRSDKLSRLFEFLLERTIAGRPPSELEIAREAFASGREGEGGQDATVRVYVHRLRKALETVYAARPGPRITIPKGEYRLVLIQDEPAEETPEAVQAPSSAPAAARFPWKLVAAALVVLLSANLVAWMVLVRPAPAPPALAGTRLWQAIAQDHRPITVVLGDYYLFAESPAGTTDGTAPPRLVRNPAINAREDLDIYLMAHPEKIGRAVDRDLRYVPSGAVAALGDLFRALSALRGGQAAPPSLIAASQLTPDILKTSDVVYVGQFSGLGTLLRNPLFQASGFKVGSTYDELIDGASGHLYRSDGGIVQADEHIPRRDFGYLASLPGPSGNHLVVIVGMRDPALLQMAELAVAPDRLKPLDQQAARGIGGFEALYQVRTMGALNLDGALLLLRPLRSGGIWDQPNASQRFPDDAYEGAGHARR